MGTIWQGIARRAWALAATFFCIAMLSVPAAAEDVTIIHAGRLLTVPGERVETNKSIIVRGGKISAIQDGFVEMEPGGGTTVTVIDLSDQFVLPGLIDGHVHLSGELGPRSKLENVERSDPDVAFVMARNAKKTLMAGFTTVRDQGATGGDAIFALRDAIARGDVPGPRIFAAGRIISPTGGHGQTHGFREDIEEVIKSTGVCDGVADCRRAVRDQVRRGANHIKLVATGGVLSETDAGTDKAFFDDELKAIIDTAHLLGRKTSAHAHGTAGINAALRAGVDSIEHGTFANAESFRLFKRTGAYLVPTVVAGVTVTEMAEPDNTFMPPPIRKKALAVGPQLIKMLREAHKAGVKIAFGTDSGVSPHGLNAREFELMVQAGMTPEETIVSATVNGADNLGKSDLLGTIAPGKWADMIAVEGNPLQNVSLLRSVAFVMKGGQIYKAPH